MGIDDWAWRKGHHYGTILVDLQQGRPIDLLADRATATVTTWCQAHPTVDVVARDRAEGYAAGIRHGAPTAVQVADRFHLFQNVAEVLEQVFTAHTQDLEAINAAQRQAPVPLADGTVAVPVPPPPQAARAQDTAAHRRAQRLATYEQVWALHRQGYCGEGDCPAAGYWEVDGLSVSTHDHLSRAQAAPPPRMVQCAGAIQKPASRALECGVS